MRFDKDTRALIHQAGLEPTTITWPKGSEPKIGRLYWVQAERTPEEEDQRAKAKLEREPNTCAEVMAVMNAKNRGEEIPLPKSKRKKGERERPSEGDPRILVIGVEVLEHGFGAIVALHFVADPVNSLRIPAVIPAGLNPIFGYHESTETEPEQMLEPFSLRRRAEQEDAIRLEHKASIDRTELDKADRHLRLQREQGKPSTLAEAAACRARKRAENPSEAAVTHAA